MRHFYLLALTILLILSGRPTHAQTAGTSPFDGTKLRAMTVRYRTMLPKGIPNAPAGLIDMTGVLSRSSTAESEVWELSMLARSGVEVQSTDVDFWNVDDLAQIHRRSVVYPGSFFELERTSAGLRVTTVADGEETTEDLKFDKPFVSDGMLNYFALGTLPLKPGYETEYNSYVRRKGSVRTHRVRVTGTKTVRVPAGEFETYVVTTELKNEDSDVANATWYVSIDEPRVAVRLQTPLPSGGTVTVDLIDVR
jgi:hypothetical protein